MSYVIRHGQRIEVMTIHPHPTPKQKRKAFEPRFIKVPRHWISALGRSNSANTYRLAMLILIEAFRNKRRNGEVALSTATTGMPRNTKARAARELVDLGLIQLQEDGTGALRARVISDSYKKEENYKN
jgi:hypothetical protein